ncbi:hypothetical protein ABZP36_003352 [Zizania latifolia]
MRACVHGEKRKHQVKMECDQMPLALKSLMRPKVTAMAAHPPSTTRALERSTAARPSTAPTHPNAPSAVVATATTTATRSL